MKKGNKRMKKQLLTAAILVALASLLFYHCTKNVAGGTEVGNPSVSAMLYEPDGTPAKNATVYFYRFGTDPRTGLAAAVFSTTTNANGNYTALLDSGTYDMLASKNGTATFQDSIKAFIDSTIHPPADTLKAFGSISGKVLLQGTDDPRTVFVLFMGTNIFTMVQDSLGNFTAPGMAKGKYKVRLLSILDDYKPMDTSFVIKAGVDSVIPESIRLEYKGIPTPSGLSIAYDTLRQIVTLTWNKADTALIDGYNVYRAIKGQNFTLISTTPLPETVNVFSDSTVAVGKTYQYEVVSRKASGEESRPAASSGDTVKVIPWYYGNAGTIMFNMGSYSGAQYPAEVIVYNSGLTVQSIPIRIKSRGDTAGFTLVLKKDPTTYGQYLDSIRFSINATDSAKHMIKVQQAKDAMGDSIYAIYNYSAPAANDTAMVMWSGNNGEVNPGASMYDGLTTKITINVNDPDVMDSFIVVTIKSPADSVVGIPLLLPSVAGSWGTYSGLLGVTTGPSSAANRTIKVTGKDYHAGELITILYQDITPYHIQAGSICTWRPVCGSISLDSTRYHGTASKMDVILFDDDITANSAAVMVKSKKDTIGIFDTLKYSGSGASRIFSGKVSFSTTTSNTATGVIAVQSDDLVSVTYVDDTPDTLIVQKAQWFP
jgi:hypothetical protein